MEVVSELTNFMFIAAESDIVVIAKRSQLHHS